MDSKMGTPRRKITNDLRLIFMVAKRIKKMFNKRSSAFQNRNLEIEREIIDYSKDLRKSRNGRIGANHRFVLEMAADFNNVDTEEIVAGIIDSDKHIDILDSLFSKNGILAALIILSMQEGYPLSSGRYSRHLRYAEVNRAICTTTLNLKLNENCVAVYRANNEGNITNRNINESIAICNLSCSEEEDPTALSMISRFLKFVLTPAIQSYQEYGAANETHRNKFLLSLSMFDKFLQGSNETISNRIRFEVSNDLYQGFLLAEYQIEQTAKDRQKVQTVEKYFSSWLKQIQIVLTEGKQIQRDYPDSGPVQFLQYWRRNLARYFSIRDFVDGKPFQNHLTCLKLSQSSKLIAMWDDLSGHINMALSKAKDNLRYANSLQRFWDPIYIGTPVEIKASLPSLFIAIRNVSIAGHFFNSSRNITGLFLKITNQLTISCQKFLSDYGNISIWKKSSKKLINQIETCKDLLQCYKRLYFETVENMEENKENPWIVSPVYIFSYLEKFIARIDKVKTIAQTKIMYTVLDRIRINGMEVYADQIKNARETISSKPYNPLNCRLTLFDEDYKNFIQEIEAAEMGMQAFVKKQIENVPTAEGVITTLKRFDRLDLDCLCMDRRYLDMAVILENEIVQLKDIYNLQRENPPIPFNSPPLSGRIMWIRMLFKRIDTPMKEIKIRPCVLGHSKAQIAVRYYNYMFGIFYHYDMMHHKAWFDYTDQVRPLMHTPVLVCAKDIAEYKVNFHKAIYTLIRETEAMWKLKLYVPDFAAIVTFCKDRLLDASTRLKFVVKKHDLFRRSIAGVYVNIMRINLRNLELSFKRGLSFMTWTSELLEDFIKDLENSVDNAITFYKSVLDVQNIRIFKLMNEISNQIVCFLPEDPVSLETFVEETNKRRYKIERIIESMNFSAEKAAVDLINMFADCVDFPLLDSRGRRQFQLPKEEVTDENWRGESILPIDKYDWIQFDKINRIVFFPTDELRLEACLAKYENLTYNMYHFRNDCMDLFSYFDGKMQTALVDCSKHSMELFREKILNPNWKVLALNPILSTYMELGNPRCIINPSLDKIQNAFLTSIQSAIEVHYFISNWGKHAKTPERKNRKMTGDENRHERNHFKNVSNNKDITRIFQNMQSGLSLFRQDMDFLLKETCDTHKYLWAEDREEQIKNFADNALLTADIREKFREYDEVIKDLLDTEESVTIGPIKVLMEKVIQSFVEEAKKWKVILGQILSSKYKKMLDDMVGFIKEMNTVLVMPIKDLDDVRMAMLCLDKIRENFIEMDFKIMEMVETYNMFSQFEVYIPPDDYDKVNGLQLSFNDMIEKSKQVTQNIIDIQEPLLKELKEGIGRFVTELDAFNIDFENNGPMVPGIEAKEASDRVLLFQNKFDDLWRQYEINSSGEKLFGLPVTEYPILHQRKREFNFLTRLYSLFIVVLRTIDEYYSLPLYEVDIEKITAELADFQTRCRRLPKGMQTWPAYIVLKKKIDDFNEMCPILELMTNKAMKERHWTRINNVVGTDFDASSPQFTLGKLLDAPILKYREDVEDICIGADKELDIEAKLKAVVSDWSQVNLALAPFKSRGDLLLKGSDTQEIMTALEDSTMVVNSLASNRYNAPFKREIMTWLQKLSNTGEILEKWLTVQNLWMYLEAVFVGGDIAKQLPQEAKRFSNIDKNYLKIMYRAREIGNVIECCTGDDSLSTMLNFLLEQLETCQKSLTGYLENKRLIFSRFFFVSDPVLLEILGQSSDPTTIQVHLLSIFDSVGTVDFVKGSKDTIDALNSPNGEKVPLESVVVCIGGVENWLGKLLQAMKDTMKAVIALMATNLMDPEYNFGEDFPSHCHQAALVGIQILWTIESEVALRKSRSDKTIMRNTNRRFKDLLNFLIDLTVKDLTRLERIRYETMVTIHVHQRDIFDDLVRLRIRSVIDFEWQKQCRFYYNEDNDEVPVGITDVNFIYQNEYLGVTERLAITPLTDRCYITLSQAIGMSMGGAPAGPAGTGKTETTKDMGRSLGKFVVVFNCSDQMDFRGLARIYKGLAQSGSWGCFDEFNRIELPVLSVAAQQIYIVLTARKEKKEEFTFIDGDVVPMNPEFGLFITMNPGYAGRQELPENLKIMFRTVAMMVPDRQIIIRVKLASCGFKDNIILAKKFYTVYKLCEEQLSKQVHYDFGLRNILSVLRTLGAQKRAHPNNTEETIVMRVLRDMNVSKLIDEDEILFLSLIEDMFPSVKLTQSVYRDLQRAIGDCVKEVGYVNNPEWNLKVVQLYETSLVRHGLMIMGPTGAGKTSCTNILLKSFTHMGRPHREMRMNPKAITAPQMFGRLDVATNDWTDGIFSVLWRRSLRLKPNEHVWIILDGPVDAVWIENLNSVLDDNKTLTLANGDRIKMADNCKLVFEPDNVDNASPATVSRVGMVYMSSSVLSWRVYVEAWLQKRTPPEAEIFRKCFDEIYDEAHTFVQTRLSPKMNLLEALYIKQFLLILDGLLDDSYTQERYLGKIFIFGLMWTLGAVLELDDRFKLQEFMLQQAPKLQWPKRLPDTDIFEYLVEKPGSWAHWSTRVDPFIYPEDSIPEFASILVPNVDNVRSAFLLDTIAKQSKCVLLIGEQGTAKTVMIQSYMSGYDKEEHLSKSFNFSSATTPNMYQRIIESYVEKRVGLTYGPPGQRKMTAFIDDINMPIINEWGDQITNEIVRQMIEQTGFYSLDRPGDFIIIADIQLLAAMIHPGGGRNDIPNRLKRQFCVFNCTLPSNQSMDQIFRQIALGYFSLNRFEPIVVEAVPFLVPLTRELWQNVKAKMLPTPANFHYVFNLRDLSRIWEGMLKIAGPECTTVSTLLKLWRHECCRVISDRFTNKQAKEWFITQMQTDAQKSLGPYFADFPAEETFFVDFLRDAPDAPAEGADEDMSFEPPKIYEEIPSFEVVKKRVEYYMSQFNEFVRGFSLNYVFFRDALVDVMITSRIIRTARGNALLVGVGGSGKRSLTRLASFIAGYKFFQITITRSYNAQNLMEDFKYLYRTAGLEGHGITFIFSDNDITEEGFLEYINNVLSSGEIANLFLKDELDEIRNDIIPIMKKIEPRRPPTPDDLYDFFITRARANLHVVLCFSPIGEKFRGRALKFPGLISGCTINWIQTWPADARIAVSRHHLQNFNIVCTPEVKEEVITIMSFIHESVYQACSEYFEKFRRSNYITPKTLISFLNSYKELYQAKRENILVLAKRMSGGLHKLEEASESVAVLKIDLIKKNEELAVATGEAEEVLKVVSKKNEDALVVKAEVAQIKSGAEKLVKSIAIDKETATKKLEKARPALEEAEAALKTIRAADIATVRTLGRPPHLITLIMDCVLIFFRRQMESVKTDPDREFLIASWPHSLRMMADTSFLRRILEYPKDIINAEMIDLLVPYFRYSTYNFEAAKVACGNVAGLLSWTQAMAKYYDINREVLPLKANLAMQEAKYNKATSELAAAEALFQEKELELNAVKAQFDEAMGKKEAVFSEAHQIQVKTDTATSLIDGLSGEKTRWTDQLSQFQSETNRLVGDVLYLTAFLSYTGPFNQEFRTNLQNTWMSDLLKRKIPTSSNINIIDSLTDSSQIGEWNIQGLPTDDLSIQNGIIATKATRFPLLIDPQSQGKIWIKNKEKDFDLIVSTLNNKYFRNFLEDCVSMGRPLLIEDIGEELDPVLDNILDRNLIRIGTSYKVKVGDKELDWSNNFRLYITTKLPNPAYSPEVCARSSVIDFTVTMKGLEDQLLGRVIMTEKKELEEERQSLIETVTTNMRNMKELEENLLHKLSTIQGSLLDDETVLDVLNTSQNTAAEVREKLAIAKRTEQKINVAREEYRPVATRGSVLYFLITSMANVNVMYQISLVQFLERFDVSMLNSKKTHITSERIKIIIDYLTYEIYRYTSRGLYEEHKYLFVLLMALNIDQQIGTVSYEEFETFVKGGAALNLNDCPPKPFAWISDEAWLNLVELSKLRQFIKILDQVSQSERSWRVWYQKDAPENEILPNNYNNLDMFRKLLLVRAWCPDRIISQSRKYIQESLGERFTEPVILNFDVLFSESSPLKPMICFLSMGSDPSPNIEALTKKYEVKCHTMSMGQGQEVHARKIITTCLSEGGWVLLQNCHLGLEYMDELIELFLELEKDQSGFHEDFRLWMTTEVAKLFPITLLQLCIKFTNEPPAGIRAGLKGTYTNLTQDFLDYSENPMYHPLVYAISFLHSVVQERRKYGPLGWNIPYEFNSADWLASCMFVQNHLDDLDPKRGISWVTVRYMLGEVQYGGRVTDDYDKRLLNTFAKTWFTDQLFDESFEFYTGYKIYKFKLQEDYLEAIQMVPAIDPPQVYGFHSNADISYQKLTAKNILDTIISIQPKGESGAGGVTREGRVAAIARDMLSKLPPPYDLFDVRERLRKMGFLRPMHIFLRQEIDRMQRILVSVRETLTDLVLAIEGTIVMSETLRDALDNMFDAKVPDSWLRRSWISSSLGFWFTELIDRNGQLHSWCFIRRPVVFWMTGFFNPQGFLTAMLQEVARANKGWALDQITMHNEVTKQYANDLKKPPKNGVYIHGLFLDGAGWNRKNCRIVEASNKILYVNMPVIYLTAVQVPVKNPMFYECPVYKIIKRTDRNFITALNLDSAIPPDHWIIRGVALLGDIK